MTAPANAANWYWQYKSLSMNIKCFYLTTGRTVQTLISWSYVCLYVHVGFSKQLIKDHPVPHVVHGNKNINIVFWSRKFAVRLSETTNCWPDENLHSVLSTRFIFWQAVCPSVVKAWCKISAGSSRVLTLQVNLPLQLVCLFYWTRWVRNNACLSTLRTVVREIFSWRPMFAQSFKAFADIW